MCKDLIHRCLDLGLCHSFSGAPSSIHNKGTSAKSLSWDFCRVRISLQQQNAENLGVGKGPRHRNMGRDTMKIVPERDQVLSRRLRSGIDHFVSLKCCAPNPKLFGVSPPCPPPPALWLQVCASCVFPLPGARLISAPRAQAQQLCIWAGGSRVCLCKFCFILVFPMTALGLYF